MLSEALTIERPVQLDFVYQNYHVEIGQSLVAE